MVQEVVKNNIEKCKAVGGGGATLLVYILRVNKSELFLSAIFGLFAGFKGIINKSKR